MQIPNDVQKVISFISAKTGLSEKVLFCWMIAENSDIENGFPSNNNPLNIRYLGNVHPWQVADRLPWFAGTNGIQGNEVVTYESPEAFAVAVPALLSGLPQYYQPILDTAGKDDVMQATAIEESPWDAANYDRKGEQPGHIVELVQSVTIDVPAPAPTEQPAEAEAQQPPTQDAPTSTVAEEAAKMVLEAGSLWNLLDDTGKAVLHSHIQAIRTYLKEVQNIDVE